MNFAVQNALRLAGNLILTRLLFPEAFGIMALVQIVMTGLNLFSEIGIRASIIQDDRGEDPIFLDTAWCLQIGRGLVLWALTWVVAQPVADFYEAPILAQILPVAGLTALFQGFNSTKMATVNRNLMLGRLTLMSVGAQIAGLISMIALAWWLQSVWALVIGGLVAPLLTALLSHVTLPGHRNWLRFDREAAARLISFGKWVFLATVAGFLANYADRAILGKIVSLTDLALYNIAFLLASVPLLLLRRLSDQIVFPLYRSVPPRESASNRTKITRARTLLTTTVLTMTAILAVIGNDLIHFLYDVRYAGAGPILVLLALAQIPGLVTTTYSMAPLAAGDSRRFALLTACSAGVRTLCMLLGASLFGLVGVIIAPVIAVLLYYPLMVWVTLRYRAWHPGHDIAAFFVGGLVAALALRLNPEALTFLISGLGGKASPG